MNTAGRPVSPRRVELGLFLPIVQPINRQPWEDAASPAVVLDIARHAESVGLDFVTVQDHGAIAAPGSTIRWSCSAFWRREPSVCGWPPT
jgi:hypothetical protein